MNFFLLGKAQKGGPPFGTTSSLAEDPFVTGDDVPRCPTCSGFIDIRPWLPPFNVSIQVCGPEFGDIAYGTGTTFLVSDKFKRLMERERIKGIERYDLVNILSVETNGKRPASAPPTYYSAIVFRSRTAVDVIASGMEWSSAQICPDCLLDGIKRWARIVIDETTWDGLDIFKPRGFPGSVICTEIFKDVCENNGIRNALFTPAEDYAHDFYPLER